MMRRGQRVSVPIVFIVGLALSVCILILNGNVIFGRTPCLQAKPSAGRHRPSDPTPSPAAHAGSLLEVEEEQGDDGRADLQKNPPATTRRTRRASADTEDTDSDDASSSEGGQGVQGGGGGGGGDVDDDEITLAKLERLYHREKRRFEAYYDDAMAAADIRKRRGTLKIAGFTRLWPPPIHNKGGMQYHAMHLYSRLASLGHKVFVFTTGPPGAVRPHHFSVHPKTLKVAVVHSKEEADLTVFQCPSSKNTQYSVQWYESTLKKYNEIAAKIGGFDVAHSESWAAVANTYQLGVPLAVTWHGSMMDWFRNEMNQIVQNWRLKGKMPSKDNAYRLKSLGESIASETFALQTVPHHIVISDSARDDLITTDLIPPERVHLVYNGVNEENYRPDKSVRHAFLNGHGVDPSSFVVGCGGRLAPEKGHGQLARAMEVVLSRDSSIVLLVAGSGGEGKKYQRLKAKGLKVVMIGMLSQDELAKFYNAIDVFADPYWQHHGLNTVMIEAALSATPIIATGLPPSKTTIPNAAFGQTFGLGIKEDLVRAVMFFKRHPDFKERVGKNLRERALKLFTSTVMAAKYEHVFYSAVENPTKLTPVLGDVTCRDTYPAMCYRMPKKEEEA